MLKNSKVVLFLSPSKVGQVGNFWTLLRTTSYDFTFKFLSFFLSFLKQFTKSHLSHFISASSHCNLNKLRNVRKKTIMRLILHIWLDNSKAVGPMVKLLCVIAALWLLINYFSSLLKIRRYMWKLTTEMWHKIHTKSPLFLTPFNHNFSACVHKLS